LGIAWKFIDYLTWPFSVIGNAYTWLVQIWDASWGAWGHDPVEIAGIFLFIVFSIVVLDALDKGDWEFLYNLASRAWGVANAILQWAYNLIQFIVRIILEALPG
jgi:hypothetical protein